MAKNENQKLKLIYILKMLYQETDEEHGVTIKDIQEMLERHNIKAERKSLYNDIATLEEFGLDIIRDKHDRTMYYKLVSREFELAELKLLVDAVQSSKFITVNKTDALIKKLEGLTSKYEAGELQRQVHVANRVKNSNEKIYLSVDALHSAIHKGVQVEFLYTAWNMKKELEPKHGGKIYRISPWGLVWDDENYYLVGYDEAACKIKHYRVDKIDKLNETSIPRQGEEYFRNYDMAAYSKKTFGMYGGEEHRVKLKVDNKLVGVILDRFGTDVALIPVKGENYFTVNVDVSVSGPFLGWIAGLGSGVEIVAPKDVRLKMADMVKGLNEKYRIK
ncbi:MAG: transcriptional regulator [Clostridium sp.]|nr:transcriptional regulator [Clostridium sp.]MCM1398276.1 transcriptional regulator [Clostridium sp.]MCM1459060.1 transcriptional regulator [Bacteroides sp.]